MVDLLVLAVLAGFLLQIAPLVDTTTFVVGVSGLAAAAGLGGGRLLRGPLSLAALIVWLVQEVSRRPEFGWIYVALVGVLLICYLTGRFIRLTSWALPIAALMALLGLGLLGTDLGGR